MLISLSRQTIRYTILVAILTTSLGSVIATPAGAAPPASSPEVNADESDQEPARVFELRIYTAAPGKMELLHERFRRHTLRIFKKHGIESVGYWTSESEPDRLYYLVAYPDRASREQRLVKGIAKDAEFLKAVAESEKDGKLTTVIESVILNPTNYSPMK
jgi:hypothetical protein